MKHSWKAWRSKYGSELTLCTQCGHAKHSGVKHSGNEDGECSGEFSATMMEACRKHDYGKGIIPIGDRDESTGKTQT